MSIWTENISAKFYQKIQSGYLKICKIRQGITFLPHPVVQHTRSHVSFDIRFCNVKLTWWCRWRPSLSWTRGRVCPCSTTTVCGRYGSRQRLYFTSLSTATSRGVTTTAIADSATRRAPNTSLKRRGTTSRCGSSDASSRPSSPCCTSWALPRDIRTTRRDDDVVINQSISNY